MPFFTIGYYLVHLDFLWFFWRFLTRFLCFFSYLSFLWHVDIPLFNRRFFSFFGKFLNSALFFEKHHFFDFQLFHHCWVFCKSTSFSVFFVQICVSPPRNLHFPRNEGVGEGLQKHMHNGEPTRAKEQAFVVLFFFTIKPLESAGQSAKTYYKKWAPDCQKSQQFFAPILKK